jgi:hypothetical protein
MLSHGECCVPISLHKTLRDMVQVIDLKSEHLLDRGAAAGHAGRVALRVDGVWMIPENSPQAHTAARALAALLPHA